MLPMSNLVIQRSSSVTNVKALLISTAYLLVMPCPLSILIMVDKCVIAQLVRLALSLR